MSWSHPHNPLTPVTMILLQNTGSALLSHQLEETLRSPLLRMATKQAAPAKAVEIRTAVVLDRIGHQGILQGTHFLSRFAHTFRVAVENVLESSHHLDAVLLNGGDDEGFELLYGAFPTFDS